MTDVKVQSRSGAVLVMTIGTGDRDRLEETLFQPLEKSFREGHWAKAILLPSQITQENAQQFKERLRDFKIDIQPLPEKYQENDADACFGHFDRVLNSLLKKEGHKPENIRPDFTRGTKAMSAALVLAATYHGLPKLRYVQGDKRDERGMVIPGSEKVSEVQTDLVTIRRRLDDARNLMKEQAFAAVPELLKEDKARPTPERFKGEIERLRSLSLFWSAWDRLDYRKACDLADKLVHKDREKLALDIKLVRVLAGKPDRQDCNEMARWLRLVVSDLLDNGRRRIQQKQFEDALLRAYRVLELIGQLRLFEKGYDSGHLIPDDPEVKSFNKYISKESHGLGEDKGYLTASRMQVARFLKYLDDPFGQKLLKFDEDNKEVKAKARNNSILIHGFEAAPLDSSSLDEIYNGLEILLREALLENHLSGDFGRIP